MSFWQDTPGQFQKSPNLWEQWQQPYFQQAAQQGMAGMQDPTKGFEPIAKQARTQFDTQTIPGIAERFTAMGGGQRSSAFEGALGQAGAGFNENLAAMKSQYGMQNMGQMMQMLQMGLSPQTQTQYSKGTPAGIMQLLAPFMQGIGAGAPGVMASYFDGQGGAGGGQQQGSQQAGGSSNWIKAFLSMLGTAGGAAVGGPVGAGIGGSLGSAAGGLF